MYSLATLSVFFAICSVINAQQNSCITVNGKQGECISINDCKPLYAVITKPERTAEDTELLKRSHCGFKDKIPAVCCPPVEACYTPEGKPGECLTLDSCPNLKNLLSSQDNNKVQHVEKSRCISPDTYCCGPIPDFKPVQKGGCKNRVTAFPPDPATECCGVDSSFADKIVGGESTAIDEYPWLALIEYDSSGVTKTLCGGALISGRYVLTAGHCVLGKILNANTPKSVRLGEYDTSKDGQDCARGGVDCNEGITRIPIEKIIPHPEYAPPQKRNDIALIRMAQMARFTDFIRPICLPRIDVTQISSRFNTTVAGWGAISQTVRSSAVKLKVDLPYVEQTRCQAAYRAPGRNINLWKGQLCAGGVAGKDSCKGDSGGPLMYENGKTYEVIGIVSFGPNFCGQEDVPGIYTNVYEYNPWIRSNIVP